LKHFNEAKSLQEDVDDAKECNEEVCLQIAREKEQIAALQKELHEIKKEYFNEIVKKSYYFSRSKFQKISFLLLTFCTIVLFSLLRNKRREL